MAGKVAEGTKVTAGRVFAWMFGVLFIMAGFGATITRDIAFGIPLLLAGLILLPVMRRAMRERAKVELPSWLIAIVVCVLLVISFSHMPRSADAPAAAVSAAPTTFRCTTGEIVNALRDCPARTISYDDLMRNSDSYAGARVKYTGEVVQVTQRDDGTFVLRVDVTNKVYWTDTIWVEYSGPRVLENDLVTLTGTFEGLTTYQAVLGNDITIPKITADAIVVTVKAADR
jgi:hypothetical protein